MDRRIPISVVDLVPASTSAVASLPGFVVLAFGATVVAALDHDPVDRQPITTVPAANQRCDQRSSLVRSTVYAAMLRAQVREIQQGGGDMATALQTDTHAEQAAKKVAQFRDLFADAPGYARSRRSP